jgi:hypothetical protein
MIVKGFWHIYAVTTWYPIITDQLRVLITSGLYDRSEEISIGFIGDEDTKNYFQKFVLDLYPKLKLKYYSNRPEDYEFPTIRLIEKDTSEYVGYYFHAKGVTKPFDLSVNHWRAWLNEAILNRWEQHCANVEQFGYDVSSVNYLQSPNHFSGNFWWFNRKYIDRLPKVDNMDWTYRWGAEQWICKGPGKYYKGERKEPSIDTFKIEY